MRSAGGSVLSFLVCFSCFAADRHYERFLSVLGTNVAPIRIRSPLLVDTNNTTPKLTNFVAGLLEAKARGEVAGIRLGMTMGEVLASWGKPPYFYSRCFGGPRLCYVNASVVFDPLTNSVMKVLFWDDARSPLLTVEDCTRILGEPSSRIDPEESHGPDLIYTGSGLELRLYFSGDKISVAEVVRPSGDGTEKH